MSASSTSGSWTAWAAVATASTTSCACSPSSDSPDEPEQAREAFATALALTADGAWPQDRAQQLADFAEFEHDEGRLDDAARLFEQARAVADTASLTHLEAQLTARLAGLDVEQGRAGPAERRLGTAPPVSSPARTMSEPPSRSSRAPRCTARGVRPTRSET